MKINLQNNKTQLKFSLSAVLIGLLIFCTSCSNDDSKTTKSDAALLNGGSTVIAKRATSNNASGGELANMSINTQENIIHLYVGTTRDEYFMTIADGIIKKEGEKITVTTPAGCEATHFFKGKKIANEAFTSVKIIYDTESRDMDIVLISKNKPDINWEYKSSWDPKKKPMEWMKSLYKPSALDQLVGVCANASYIYIDMNGVEDADYATDTYVSLGEMEDGTPLLYYSYIRNHEWGEDFIKLADITVEDKGDKLYFKTPHNKKYGVFDYFSQVRSSDEKENIPKPSMYYISFEFTYNKTAKTFELLIRPDKEDTMKFVGTWDTSQKPLTVIKRRFN